MARIADKCHLIAHGTGNAKTKQVNFATNIALKTCEFNKSESNIKHLFVCCYYFRTITKKGFFPCLFGHSLVTGLWFGGAIAVYSIMKVNRLHEPSP